MRNIEYRKLISYNVAGRELRQKRKLLIYGTCVRDEYPEIYLEYEKKRVPLAVCLEEEHFNMVALKLASIIARIDLEEIVILTVDGSPHCLQLHHIAEEVEKITCKNVNIRHLVIENKKVIEIDKKTIKTARYLSKIKKLLYNNINNS